MDLVRKIFNSIVILIGIAILVVLSAVAVMMLFDVSIFGYTYLKFEKIVESNHYVITQDIEEVNIETNNVGVKIVYTSLPEVQVILNASLQGVVKDNVKEVSLATCEFANNKLTVKTTEPEGFMFVNSSYVQILVPDNFAIKNMAINSATDNINFEHTVDNTINNLTINSTANHISYTLADKLVIEENLSIKNISGRIYINSQIKGNVNIESDWGTYIFRRNNNSILLGLNDINIKGTNPLVEIGNFEDTNNTYSVLGNLNVTCEGKNNGGIVKVAGTIVGNTYFNAPNLEFYARTVNGHFNVQNGIKVIEIENLNKGTGYDSLINSGAGFVKIKNSYCATLTVTSDKNDVIVENAYGNVSVNNNYGATKVNFADGVVGKTINITSENGLIEATNIQGKATLTTGNGTINAIFANVVENNVIKTNFDANIQIKDNLQYKLTTSTKRSDGVSVDLGSVEYYNCDNAVENNGYLEIVSYPNGASQSTTNELKVQSNSGFITIEKY